MFVMLVNYLCYWLREFNVFQDVVVGLDVDFDQCIFDFFQFVGKVQDFGGNMNFVDVVDGGGDVDVMYFIFG